MCAGRGEVERSPGMPVLPAFGAAAVVALSADPERLSAMQVQNYRYYQRFVRPDRLIANSLLTALDEAWAGSEGTDERLLGR